MEGMRNLVRIVYTPFRSAKNASGSCSLVRLRNPALKLQTSYVMPRIVSQTVHSLSSIVRFASGPRAYGLAALTKQLRSDVV